MRLGNMNIRACAITTLCSFIGTGFLLCPSLVQAAPNGEEVVTARICTAGPAAAVAQGQRQQGQAQLEAAAVLPNPDLVLDHQRNLAGPEDHETTIGLSVPLGIGGRWFLLKDAAAARRDQAYAAAGATLFDWAISFRRAYGRATLDEARLAVLTSQQTALHALADTIRALAKSGENAPYQLLRQETQARLHQRKVDSMKARVSASRRWLQTWAGAKVALDPSKLLGLAGGEQPLRATAGHGPRRAHPQVRSLEAAARASAIEAKAERRRWVPDLSVFAGYRNASSGGTTGHGISLGLTLPLTIFDHGQGRARRADAEQELAAARATRLERSHSARLSAEVARLTQLEASAVGLDKMVSVSATLQGKARTLYAADEATIAELLDAYRVVEETQLARIDAIGEIVSARLDLMSAAGTQFDPALDRACGDAKKGGQQ